MLVLNTKEGERTAIGRNIVIAVVECRGNRVRLGITAPQGTPIDREGVVERIAGAESHEVAGEHRERSHRERQLSVRRNNRPTTVDGDGQAPGRLLRSGKIAAIEKAGASDEWQSRLRGDRPIYGCPKCRQSAMQFHATHDDHPGRTDFFYCSACGTCWEI